MDLNFNNPSAVLTNISEIQDDLDDLEYGTLTGILLDKSVKPELVNNINVYMAIKVWVEYNFDV